ncbi:MAG: trypsin-like peptidase domain-containing protein, partial [Phycisphaerales bacterium]
MARRRKRLYPMITSLRIAAALALACGGTTFAQEMAFPGPTPPHAGPAGPTGVQRLELAVHAALARSLPSVVRVYFGEGEMISGTVITPEGLVLTCAHIPAAVGDDVQIGLADGRIVKAKVATKLPREGESNAGRDLAIIRIAEPGRWTCAELAAKAPSDPDALMLAAGFPDTMLYGSERDKDPLYVRLGRASRRPDQPPPTELRTSVQGTGGDSGGALFDLGGRLIGVTHGGELSGSNSVYTRIEVLHENWGALGAGAARPAVSDAPAPRAPTFAELSEVAERTHAAVVEVCSNSRWVALGCVVAEGFVLTKASELGPGLTVRTRSDTVAIAEIVATDPGRDLALLKLPFLPEAAPMKGSLDLAAAKPPTTGDVVTLATPPFLTPLTGIVSVGIRPVARLHGFVPCEFESCEGGIRVVRVVEEVRPYRIRRPALPLAPGDIVTAIEGTPVGSWDRYKQLMFGSDRLGVRPIVSGEQFRVTYRRGDTSREGTVVLEFANTPPGQLVRPVSNRYSGFEMVVATDLPARPEHCGGPVLDSEGNVTGILIARAPFVESFVLPASELARSLDLMKLD